MRLLCIAPSGLAEAAAMMAIKMNTPSSAAAATRAMRARRGRRENRADGDTVWQDAFVANGSIGSALF